MRYENFCRVPNWVIILALLGAFIALKVWAGARKIERCQSALETLEKP